MSKPDEVKNIVFQQSIVRASKRGSGQPSNIEISTKPSHQSRQSYGANEEANPLHSFSKLSGKAQKTSYGYYQSTNVSHKHSPSRSDANYQMSERSRMDGTFDQMQGSLSTIDQKMFMCKTGSQMLQSPTESDECYNFKQFEELIMQMDKQSQSSQKD